MRDKLCIIISTIYPTSIEPIWQDEVNEDLSIVKETLHDHRCIDIFIPFIAGRQAATQLVNKILNNIAVTNSTVCHLVLNTHGTPGFSDLKHEIVADIVRKLSQKNVVISQISALLCDGMVAQTIQDARKISRHHFFEKTKNFRRPSMVVLQKILSDLTTDISQNFSIRGFNYAYLPKNARSEIEALLKGEGGEVLQVATKVFIPPEPEDYAEQIRDSLRLISDYKNKTAKVSVQAYETAATFLGKILLEMKNEVFSALKRDTSILEKSECQSLFNALDQHANLLDLPFDAKNFDKIYHDWLKSNKVYSESRRTVFEHYAQSYLDAHIHESSTVSRLHR
jgi:hypothetical protein